MPAFAAMFFEKAQDLAAAIGTRLHGEIEVGPIETMDEAGRFAREELAGKCRRAWPCRQWR